MALVGDPWVGFTDSSIVDSVGRTEFVGFVRVDDDGITFRGPAFVDRECELEGES